VKWKSSFLAGPFFLKYYLGDEIRTKEFVAKCSTYMTNDEYEILNQNLTGIVPQVMTASVL